MKLIIIAPLLIGLCAGSCSSSKGIEPSTNSENRGSGEAQTPENVSRLETRVTELEKRQATMDEKLAKIAETTSGGPQSQPGSNKKLSQASAEKAIRTFASTSGVSPIRGTFGDGACSFNVQSIARIEPLSQFADAEATSIVVLKCPYWPLPFKFVFQKDVENQWFLTKIGRVEGFDYNTGMFESMIAPHQNLKVPAK